MSEKLDETKAAIAADLEALRAPHVAMEDGSAPSAAARGSPEAREDYAVGVLLEAASGAIEAYRATNDVQRDSVHTDPCLATVLLAGQNAILRALRELATSAGNEQALDVVAVASVAYQAGYHAGFPRGETAGVELAEGRRTARRARKRGRK